MATVGIQIRAGLHTGECVRRNEDVQGIAVHIGARVSALAQAGEVLVTGTVRDLVIGSGLAFADRGARRLKGVPGEWHIYAATTAGAEPATELAAAPPQPAARTDDALVGRERELRELTGVVDAALEGRGAIVLLGGEPGIGKSSLSEAVARHAQERGAAVMVGRCWESGGAPAYWPWVQALRGHVRAADPQALRVQVGTDGPELAPLLPELAAIVPEGAGTPAPDTEGARFRLFAAIAAFLHRAAAAQPLTVFLDDMHAADPASLLLLRYLADELAREPIAVVACHREAEPGSTLAEILPELARAASAHRVSLRGMAGAETAKLLELTTGNAPSPELVARVQAQTAGNPLFAIEIGRLLAADEQPQERLPIPEGVTEVINQRLLHRSERCREVLVLASVVGREFAIEPLERVSDLAEEELYDALEEAESARLIGEVPGASGRLRFSHVLMRDALYDDLPAARRLRLHRRVADALESLYARGPEPHAAELAHHYLQAGSGAADKALAYATLAGDQAASQYGYEEAARHYASALEILEATEAPDEERTGELLLSLGDALGRAGSEAESKEALRRAAQLAERAGRPDQLARAAFSYGGRFGWARAGTDPALVPLLERALEALGERDDPMRVRLLARLSAARRDDRRSDRRVALAREAVAVATRIGDPAGEAYAVAAAFFASEAVESAGNGIAVGAKLIALAEQMGGDREQEFLARDIRLQSFWIRGDRAALDVEFDLVQQLAEELRQPARRWWVSACRTMIALMEGRFAAGEKLIAETLALGHGSASWNAAVSHRLALFVLRHAQGRLAELEDTISRAVHEFPTLPRFQCALAHLYGELGREREARTVLGDLLARDLAEEHVDAEWLFSVNLLADPAASLADEDAAVKVYDLLLPHERLYARAPVEAAFGAVARSLGVLATTLRDYEAAERHFEDAMEMERRMRARPWLAHAQRGLAAMLLARGEPGDAARAATLQREALETYRALGMDAWAARVAQPSSRS